MSTETCNTCLSLTRVKGEIVCTKGHSLNLSNMVAIPATCKEPVPYGMDRETGFPLSGIGATCV